MKITNYSQIADRYDKNEFRQKVGQDCLLKEYLEGENQPQYNVLDLACGTGIYLYNQNQFLRDVEIKWYGLDASEDMLKIAREKVTNANFVNALAEDMPYEPNYFDYIVNNYAFMHFTKKLEVLDEITRVLKKNGIFKMHNIAIHEMKNWWVYKYFPSAYDEDLKRYWEKDRIFNELSIRGFEVEIFIEYKMQSAKVSELLKYVENRDISVLTLISDEEYYKGLERMRNEVSNEPEAKVVCDFAELFCIGIKL